MVTCSECGVNCHKRCKSSMPNLCGVNQKILSELLEMVRSNAPAKPKTAAVPPSKVCHFFNITLVLFVGKHGHCHSSDKNWKFTWQARSASL